MGFFSAMKKAFTNDKTMLDGWNILTDEAQVQEVIRASKHRVQLVYKHSFTCGICHMAKGEIEEEYDAISADADMYFVDVKESRPVSDALAEQTGVRHESPQVLIIKEGDVIWNASHHSIKAEAIFGVLENIESVKN